MLINWSKEDAEYMGLIKLDILGLNTLTVISETIKMIGKEIDFANMDLDNKEVYAYVFEPIN